MVNDELLVHGFNELPHRFCHVFLLVEFRRHSELSQIELSLHAGNEDQHGASHDDLDQVPVEVVQIIQLLFAAFIGQVELRL